MSAAIRQGDLFWLDLGPPEGSGPALRRPHVVIQNNVFNRSAIRTVVVCALTTNLRRAEAPGNVLLDEGEGGLPRQSVVDISQVITIDKYELVERIGTLTRARVREILDGLRLLTEPREPD